MQDLNSLADEYPEIPVLTMTDMRCKLGRSLEDAQYHGKRFFISRKGQIVAAMIGSKDYENYSFDKPLPNNGQGVQNLHEYLSRYILSVFHKFKIIQIYSHDTLRGALVPLDVFKNILDSDNTQKPKEKKNKKHKKGKKKRKKAKQV